MPVYVPGKAKQIFTGVGFGVGGAVVAMRSSHCIRLVHVYSQQVYAVKTAHSSSLEEHVGASHCTLSQAAERVSPNGEDAQNEVAPRVPSAVTTRSTAAAKVADIERI